MIITISLFLFEIILIFLLIFLYFKISRLAEELAGLKKKKFLMGGDGFESLGKEVHKQALDHLQKAEYETQKIVNSVLTLSEDVKTKLLSDIENISKRYLFEESEIMEKYALLMREDILSELKKQKVDLTQTVLEKQKQIDQELASFKATELAKIKSKSQEVLNQVLHDLLSKSLSPKDQEELIISSLTKAQNEHVFWDFKPNIK